MQPFDSSRISCQNKSVSASSYLVLISLAVALTACSSRQSDTPPTLASEATDNSTTSTNGLTNVSGAATTAPSQNQESVITLPKVAYACGADGYPKFSIIALKPDNHELIWGNRVEKWVTRTANINKSDANIRALFGNGSKDELILSLESKELNWNSNYSKDGDELARKCDKQIDAAYSDCATAANVDQCIRLRYPELVPKIESLSCGMTRSSWLTFKCEELAYDAVMQEISEYREK